jgi:DNA mismatch repair ATPase MutS
MESKNAKLQAYCYYKEQYPQSVVFFRIGDNYEAYREDAVTVNKIVGVEFEQMTPEKEVKFLIDKEFDYISLLASHNIEVKIISQRNQTGDFDIPDVDLIINDKEIDY